tara:strand:+ start:227 stop:583 length:357 start_codon:yes stop_codon:yes gene_type:complete
MPKVAYTALKGLVQNAGTGVHIGDGGFHVNSFHTTSGTENLDGSTFVTVGTGVSSFTLPASAEAGAVKLIMHDTDDTDNVVLKSTNTSLGGDLTLNADGEFAVCIYNGTKWICGLSTS